jgi:hypothetical protein
VNSIPAYVLGLVLAVTLLGVCGCNGGSSQPQASSTATAVQTQATRTDTSIFLLRGDTFKAENILSLTATYYHGINSKQKRAFAELTALVATDNGIMPDEAVKARALVRILEH